ncbi:hypothetical protein MSAN_00942100 [Mycena sanguinolenta]|uniref:Uncharacterized protein n=1 Tax=Mycena sanguinolenta TaxID=230812 RepID=A0A8H7DCS0_9AGAR|nr:hypothetical protein MSAN_00942100 [Mycena sanguinolenta]
MCLDDNSALLSVRYLNSQLSAMWENADECVRHRGKQIKIDFRSSDYLKHQYTRSLAEFHFAGLSAPKGEIAVDHLFFHGSFGKPRLEFICNHEAVLYLTLQKGHFDQVYPTKTIVRGYKSNKKDHVSFDGLEMALRLKFSRRNLSGKDSRIGNGANLIQLLILDFSSAQMILFGSNLPLGTSDALEWYLKQYLTFLQNAGHHVRYDLPDFDDDNYRLNINYSLLTRALESKELCAGVTVHGISESNINEFLRDTWLDVVSKANGLCGEPPTDKLSNCLTEIRSSWVGHLDHHFNIRFGPPRVRALCNREVVLYFTSSNIHFYESADFDCEPMNSHVDWKFAFIVDVVEDKSTPVHSLKLDLSTARFCSHLSTTFKEANIHFTYLITFFESYYLDLLVQYNMFYIYYPGGYYGEDEAPGFSDISEDESEWKLEKVGKPAGTVVVWTETVKQIKLYGFDHMIAISEASINALFASLRKAAPEGCLTKWRHGEYFHAEFSNIRVKLLSGSKALVTFTVDHGHLTLKNKKNKYNFTSWTIAYEVNIRMVDQDQLDCDKSCLMFLAKMALRTLEGDETYSTTKHIVLDFDTVKYVYKHSSMPGMWHDDELLTIEQLKSFIHFMRKYLVKLSAAGLNIIHSIPIFPAHQHFGLTSASYQIVSKDVVTVTNCMLEREAPVLMVVGMMRGRPLPAETISWGYGWVIPGRTPSHGTMCLSREAFLEGKLLSALEVVNRRTTVVPRFPCEHEEEWQVHLTTWDNHHYRRNEPCNWKQISSNNSSWLEYAWEHRDEWSYEHDSTRNKAFAFSVLCHTKNQLLVPTTYRPRSMEIIIRGESVLHLKRNDRENSNWSKRSSAKWSVTINVKSEVSGLRVTIADQVHPVFDATESESKWDIDTHKLLKQHLPRIVDIREVVRDLKKIFEGAWQYSCAGSRTYSLVSPVFTQNGDLIAQLGAFTETTITATVTSTSARPLVGRANGSAPNGTVANGTVSNGPTTLNLTHGLLPIPVKIATPPVTPTKEIVFSKDKIASSNTKAAPKVTAK